MEAFTCQTHSTCVHGNPPTYSPADDTCCYCENMPCDKENDEPDYVIGTSLKWRGLRWELRCLRSEDAFWHLVDEGMVIAWYIHEQYTPDPMDHLWRNPITERGFVLHPDHDVWLEMHTKDW